jgi:serine protease Do
MFLTTMTSRISTLLTAFTLAATLSSCGDTAILSVGRLAAQEPEIGASRPPLPSIAQRAPQFQQVFADVAEKVVPTVVSIHSAKIKKVQNFNPYHWFFGNPGPGGQQGQGQPEKERRVEGVGSGVIVSKDGYVLTNNHVVEDADDLTITLSDKREYSAKIIGTDPPSDLAVIKIEGADNLPVAHLGSSEALRIGEMVMAVGSPYQLSETVTLGIVSALGRSTGGGTAYQNFIQTDAAINPGNSGGALVNLDGSVVGINSMIFSRSGGSQGIGFAIPIDMAKSIMNSLIADGKVSRGYLGVVINDLDPDKASSLDVKPYSGVLVADVMDGTPAQQAGIEPYDIVTAINGKKVTTSQELMNQVALIKPGKKASFTILRDEIKKNFSVVLAERDNEALLAGRGRGGERGGGNSEATREKTGLTMHGINPEMARRYQLEEETSGALIVDVDATSPSARARLSEGDVVVEADRKEVSSVADFNRIISEIDNDTVLLRVKRKGATFLAALRLEE